MKSNFLSLAAMAWLAARAEAATLTVTSTADSVPRTLRAALAGAADGDSVDATRVTGTILLTSGELFVGKSVAILGNASGRVFHLTNATASIAGLTITNGFGAGNLPLRAASGGGILNEVSAQKSKNFTATQADWLFARAAASSPR